MIKTNIKMRVTPEQSKKVQEICFENNIGWYNKDKIFRHFVVPYLFIDNFMITITQDKSYYICDEREEIDADLFIRTNGSCKESTREREQYYCRSAIQYYDNVVEKIMDEETYLTKYTSQPKDLESALKKIENLHIALNKKVEKIKNQALEINKLLEQKKDLKEINDTQNIYIKNLENDLDNLKKSGCVNSNILNDYIRELEAKVNKLENKSKIDTKWIAHQKTDIDNLNRIVSEIGTKQRLEAIEHKKQLKEKDTIISYLESKFNIKR